MQIHRIRHDWPEKAGFLISRPNGHSQFTFLHFTTPVTIQINKKIIHARPGACIFYAPKTPQWFYSEEMLIHNWMHTSSDLIELLKTYSIQENTLYYPNNPAFISELFRKIELEFFSDNPSKETLIECYIHEFIICFSRAVSSGTTMPTVSRSDQIKFQQIRHEILSHPDIKWTVAQMAALANLSVSRFHAQYKAIFGSSPVQDLIAARISYAKSILLSDDTLTLPVIAEKLGYNDQFHFIRQFKSVTGLTPGEYRKNNK